MSKGVCASCGRSIDAAAKVCPYCGAEPVSGERVDTQAMLQEIFRPKELTTGESVLEYARQRQGTVILVSSIVAFLLLAALHQFVTMRNNSSVSNAPAIPLTEVTDLAAKSDELRPQAMPDLEFQYDGRPQVMRTYIIERGAVIPPDVLAAQQAEAAAKAAAAAPKPGAPAATAPTTTAAAPAPARTTSAPAAQPRRP